MESKKYLEDISEIKNMMNRSSRFISLSGLSGILAGIYAIIGAYFAYNLIENSKRGYLILDGVVYRWVLFILMLVALFSIVTGILLTTIKAKRNGEKIWDSTSKRLVINFLIPLITGGIYILLLLNQNIYGQTASLMLIFYGLALINASKHTIGNIQYLGYIEISLGLISEMYPGNGFWMWVLGFGVCHIVYGTIMYFKYDRKQTS